MLWRITDIQVGGGAGLARGPAEGLLVGNSGLLGELVLATGHDAVAQRSSGFSSPRWHRGGVVVCWRPQGSCLSSTGSRRWSQTSRRVQDGAIYIPTTTSSTRPKIETCADLGFIA